jgi:hypothetical protein
VEYICDIWDKYYSHVMRRTTMNESYGRVIAATALTILHVLVNGRGEEQAGVGDRSVDRSDTPSSFPDPVSTW